MPEIRDPVHGYISLSRKEMQIVDTPLFQRLRRIRQLGTTYLLYPSAEHTRFPHSLGVMHIATKIFDKLVVKRAEELGWNDYKISKYRQMLRLASLLHDIGHAPFSHVGDGLFDEKIKDHEGMAGKIITSPEIAKIINEIGQRHDFNASAIAAMVTGQVFTSDERLLCDIFASELDADKMDYLLRDSLFAGVKYGNFDLERILNVINLFPKGNSWHIGIDHDGVEAVEGLILARYFMFVQVYIHRTRRIYDAIMVQLVAELLRKEYGVERLPLDLTEFLKWDDCAILERAKYLDSPWSNMILNRRHFGCVYETELAPTKEERVLQRKVDNALKEELQNKYTPQEVIVDLFSKPAIKFLLPDEETPTINIISKADPTRTASFKEKAPVVAKLEEPIYAFRVYAKRNIATKVNKHIKLRREVIWGKLTEEQKGGFNHESEVAGGCSCEKEKTN